MKISSRVAPALPTSIRQCIVLLCLCAASTAIAAPDAAVMGQVQLQKEPLLATLKDLVAIESGSAAEVAAFVRERGLTYPILTGGESAASAYGVVTLPHSVLIDASGRAVGVYRGQLTREGVRRDVAALGGPVPRC